MKSILELGWCGLLVAWFIVLIEWIWALVEYTKSLLDFGGIYPLNQMGIQYANHRYNREDFIPKTATVGTQAQG